MTPARDTGFWSPAWYPATLAEQKKPCSWPAINRATSKTEVKCGELSKFAAYFIFDENTVRRVPFCSSTHLDMAANSWHAAGRKTGNINTPRFPEVMP